MWKTVPIFHLFDEMSYGLTSTDLGKHYLLRRFSNVLPLFYYTTFEWLATRLFSFSPFLAWHQQQSQSPYNSIACVISVALSFIFSLVSDVTSSTLSSSSYCQWLHSLSVGMVTCESGEHWQRDICMDCTEASNKSKLIVVFSVY